MYGEYKHARARKRLKDRSVKSGAWMVERAGSDERKDKITVL